MDWKMIYRVAATAVACVLGAGFVSGQEMWQFFVSFGKIGIVGLAIAVLLFCGAVAVVVWYAGEIGARDMEMMVAPGHHRAVKWSVTAFELTLHYVFYVLMTAGTGALGEYFGLPSWLGAVLFCVVCTAVSSLGIKKLAKVFGWLVPILTVAAIAVAIRSLFLPADAIPDPGDITATRLTANWFISAVIYFCFNFVGSVPLLVGVVRGEKPKGAALGALLALLPLGGLAFCLLIAVMVHQGSAAHHLPMMELAAACGPVWKYLYGILLLGGIFSTGFSSQGALNDYFGLFGFKKKWVLLLSVTLSGIAFAIALFGFKDLVGAIYPILGYIGFIPIAAIVVRAAIHFVRKRKTAKQEPEKTEPTTENE